MSTTAREPVKSDVFIVFSKSEPLEAKFALAVKHGLEELGRFAHEYEDWSWVDQASVQGPSPEVDRAALRGMLLACSAVLVIPPHNHRPSAGVALELELLEQLHLPVVLLRWTGMYDEHEPRGLNVIGRYQVHGTTPNDRWISGAGPNIAELLWLACSVAELRTKHIPVGAAVLDALPAFGSEPVTSFKLRAGLVGDGDHLREPRLDALAQIVTASATSGQLRGLIEHWWTEAEPVLRGLGDDGYGPITRPCRALHKAMERVVERAQQQFPKLESLTTDAMLRRAIMLTRFNRIDEAVALLTEAIARDDGLGDRLHAARALAHDANDDLESAVADMDHAVDLAPDTAHEVTHRFTRAVFRAKGGTPEAHRRAIEDYTRIIDVSHDVKLTISALNYRAIQNSAIGKLETAIADWTAVIKRRAGHPRAAAQACLNRGVAYERLERHEDARADYTAVIEWADVSTSQRFSALEGRSRVLERLGAQTQAADDIDAMLAMNVVDPESRPDLKNKAQALRAATR